MSETREIINNLDIHNSIGTNLDNGDIQLSTMTLDGQLTNIKFHKVDAIKHLSLSGNVVEIGSNYGHHISEEYKLMSCYKDRMKTKKKRVPSKTGRKQGNGTHFNSQITFTIISEKDDMHSYQVKLFTNGRLQIPGIGKLSKSNEELLEDILSVMISYAMANPDTLLLNKQNPVSVLYLKPILQNFKSLTLMAKDCMVEERIVIEDTKRFQLIPLLDLRSLEKCILERKQEGRTPIIIYSIAFNPERYSGMLVKFSTPIPITGKYYLDKFIEMVKLSYCKNCDRAKPKKPTVLHENIKSDYCEHMKLHGSCDEPDCLKERKMHKVVAMMRHYWWMNGKANKKTKPKLTTAKLFRSGRINLDHVNNHEQAVIIRTFLVDVITTNWHRIVYYEGDDE